MRSVSKKTLKPIRVLRKPITELWTKFKEENPTTKIGRNKFHEIRPSAVHTTHRNKHFVCLCETCENPKLKLHAFNKLCENNHINHLKIKNNQDLVKNTCCEKDQQIHNKVCIDRHCDLCGVDKFDF